MKSNKVRMLITDSNGTVIDEFNTEDDYDLFFEIMRVSNVNFYLTPRVTDAIEVALEEIDQKMIAAEEIGKQNGY